MNINPGNGYMRGYILKRAMLLTQSFNNWKHVLTSEHMAESDFLERGVLHRILKDSIIAMIMLRNRHHGGIPSLIASWKGLLASLLPHASLPARLHICLLSLWRQASTQYVGIESWKRFKVCWRNAYNQHCFISLPYHSQVIEPHAPPSKISASSLHEG